MKDKPNVINQFPRYLQLQFSIKISDFDNIFFTLHQILPEKPGPPRETADKLSPRSRETTEEQEDERNKAELGKGDDERSKGAYSGKPARAVGVAHPFNAEKSEGEFTLGMVGNITTGMV